MRIGIVTEKQQNTSRGAATHSQAEGNNSLFASRRVPRHSYYTSLYHFLHSCPLAHLALYLQDIVLSGCPCLFPVFQGERPLYLTHLKTLLYLVWNQFSGTPAGQFRYHVCHRFGTNVFWTIRSQVKKLEVCILTPITQTTFRGCFGRMWLNSYNSGKVNVPWAPSSTTSVISLA